MAALYTCVGEILFCSRSPSKTAKALQLKTHGCDTAAPLQAFQLRTVDMVMIFAPKP